MLNDDEEDSDGLGIVGFTSEKLSIEAMFWRIVCSLRLSLKEVDGWTLGEMRMAVAFLDMQSDYRRIWTPYFEMTNNDKD